MRSASNLGRAIFAIAGLSVLSSAGAAVLFEENFQTAINPDTGQPQLRCSGPGGAGTYPFPPGWFLRNVDNRTPDGQTAYVNEAWEVREDFGLDVANCVAFSNSYYSPVGPADDWMWTPAIGPIPSVTTLLSWRARSYDGSYPDAYEVRIMTVPPTGGTGVLGNQVSSSTVVFSTAAENTTWTTRTYNLAPYANQTIYVGFRNVSNDKFLLVVDDVKVETVPAFDPRLQQIAQGAATRGYAKVPAPLDYTFSLEATVANDGTAALSDVRVDADLLVDGQLAGSLASAPIPTLAPGATQVLPLGSAAYDEVGAWTVEALASAAQGDEEPADSVRDLGLAQVTQDELTRAEGDATGVLGIGAGNGGELGIDFTVPRAARLEAVRAVMVNNDALPDPGDGSPPGNGVGDLNGYTLSAVVRGWNDVANEPGDVMATATVTIPVDAPTGVMPLEFDFDAVELPPGRYLIAVLEPTSPAPVTLALHTMRTRYTPGSAWVIWPTSGGWANPEEFGQNFQVTFALTAVLRLPRDVPVTVDDAFDVPRTGTFAASVAGNDTPSDQGGSTWSVTVPPASGVLSMQSDGSFEYTPVPAAAGSTVTFGYRLCDADDDCANAVAELRIAVNPMPLAADDAFAVPSDRAFSASVAANDTPSADGGNVWAVATPPPSGSLTMQADGSFEYRADAAASGTTVAFTYSLCDAELDCSNASVQLQVGTNQPSAQDDAFDLFPGGSFSATVAGNDTVSDDGGNTWAVASPPASGTLELQADGAFTYTPAGDAAGTTVTFGYTLCDADDDCDGATVSLTVSAFGIFADSFEGPAPGN